MDLWAIAWLVVAANVGFAFGLFWAGREDDDGQYAKGWSDGYEHGCSVGRQDATRADAGAAQQPTEAEVEIVRDVAGSR